MEFCHLEALKRSLTDIIHFSKQKNIKISKEKDKRVRIQRNSNIDFFVKTYLSSLEAKSAIIAMFGQVLCAVSLSVKIRFKTIR